MDTLELNGTTLRLVRGDITKQEVDAVVNAANASLMGGGGVDGAIHRRGGPEILEDCKAIRREDYPDGLPTGEAVVTTAGNLPAKKVIHTVGPVWTDGNKNEPKLLANAYRHSLEQVRDNALRTVAFPSISTGAYGYPIEQAAANALQTITDYVRQHPEAFDEIRFVLFSRADYDTYRQALEQLADT